MSDFSKKQYKKIEGKLSRVSDCFCLAKWLQATIHLHLGQTHSCHHPSPHQIPPEVLEENPGALHNSPLKIQYRKQMLSNIRPFECQYCWDIDDLKEDVYSDRIIKSSDTWAEPFFKEVVKSGLGENIKPRYLEISFGNECNFKCGYCSPLFSSAHYQDYKKQKMTYHGQEVYEKECRKRYLGIQFDPDNIYVRAFWKWFPTIYTNLLVFRITGGEPLLNPNTFKVLDYLDNHPAPNLEISINSNMSLPLKKMENLYLRIKQLIDNKKIKNFRMYASIDTYGPQAEYIRHGLDCDAFFNNIAKYLEYNVGPLTFMVTYNIFSPFNFNQLLKKIMDIKKAYQHQVRDYQEYIMLMPALLHHPEYLSPKLLPSEFNQYISDNIAFMEKHTLEKIGNHGFSPIEINKLKQILSVIEAENSVYQRVANRKNFHKFVTKYDKRNNTDMVSVFPELKDFFNTLKSL